MPGAVRLVHGDMFDGPSDLIVLPCATGGSVTAFVAERMKRFTLPRVPAPMSLGDVRIVPLTEASNVAQCVAYAASVSGQRSSPEAIRHIGKELGCATQAVSIRKVNCPLLGAGAGRLRSETVFDELSQGFKEESEAGSVLRIFVRHESVYTRLVEHSGVSRTGPVRTEAATLSQDKQSLTIGQIRPRVFISYTGKDPANKQWVGKLYHYLRNNGVTPRLDDEDLRLGKHLTQWMCNEIDMADRVILVCDEEYAARADRRHGGVGWETMIIQGEMFAEMYRDQPEDAPAKFIPVIRSADLYAALPIYMRDMVVLHIPPGSPEDEPLRKLLNEILQAGPRLS